MGRSSCQALSAPACYTARRAMPARKKRILLVEDDMGISKILTLKLRTDGFDTTLAKDGIEALEMLKKNRYDLILLDLRMPRMDGFEFLKEKQSNADKTPVIVCSVLSQDTDIERARKYGIVDYLVKVNIPLQGIIDRIRKFFSGKDDTKGRS